jgi:hypothetical protein
MSLDALNGQSNRAGVVAWTITGKGRHGSHRDLIAGQLGDGSRLGLDGHLAVSLRNTSRTVALNEIQNAVLDASVIRVMGLTSKNPAA